ncbi:cholesterol 7-desaturase-like [Acanthaster planci]|uniref:cholesterol 7-desaturase n=1 Tax=Acanthaster planci TaxID=133434 RepID=A0A8B7ZCF8_ACAPL|nr:cholesterol 7-desaturase-like [Acanthaster planci]
MTPPLSRLLVIAAVLTALMSTSGVFPSDHQWTKILTLPVLAKFGLLSGLMYLAGVVHSAIFGQFCFYGNEGRDSYLIRKAPGGMTRETAITELKRSRKIGDIPPVYPNGWFAVLRSDEVKKMETKYVHALGLHLAVFRGESGRVYVVDAYCPHLGANLAVGGKVAGECIECPFHGWTYRGDDGKCVKIAYADKVPDFVNVDTYQSMEIVGLICVWYHAENEEPSWYPPMDMQLQASGLGKVGFFEAYVECHVEVNSRLQIYDKHYEGTFYVHSTKKHVGCNRVAFTDTRTKRAFWRYISPCKAVKRESYQEQLQADFVIWANKRYQARPVFIKEDSPIAAHRKWFSQFYTEHSPRFNPPNPLQW